MSEQKHTPLPWSIHSEYGHIVTGPDGLSIFECWYRGRKPDAKGNAELIVRVVNSHDDLLAALKWLVEQCTDGAGDEMVNAIGAARAAIEKAEDG